MIGKLVEGAVGGAAWGAGFAAAAGVALIGGARGKPLAKRAMKAYLVVTQRGREWVAENTERVQDVYAEARYEYETELASQETADGGGNGAGSKTESRSASKPRRRRSSKAGDAGAKQPTG